MSESSVQAPEGWKAVPLAELASFRTGPFGSTFHKSDYQSGGVPLINPSHIIDGEIVPDEQVAVAPDLASKLSVFALRENDIVIGRRGDMGRCAVVRSHQAGFLCGTGSMIVRPRPRVSPELLQAFLASPKVIAKIEENSVGTTMVNLNQGTLSALEILLPDSGHGQQAIAAALSDADGVVAGLERVIAKKRLIKQGAMQDLLTARRRLPGFSGEWAQRKLGAVAMLQRGFDLPNSIRRDGDYPVVYSNGIMASHSTFMCEGPGVVTGRSGTIGNVTFVVGKYWPHNTALWVKNFFGNSPRFIYYLLDFIDLRRFASGSGVPTLNRNDAHDDMVSVPLDIDEQNAICAVLDDMDAEIQTLESRLAKARAVKEGMMQNLLTGRVRLV